MTVAVHEPSNSLVVTAPEALFQEVETLAKMIDARSQRSVVVIPTNNATTQQLLMQAFSEERPVNGSPSAKPSNRPGSPAQTPTIQRPKN